MPVQKNEIVTTTITSLTQQGSGVGRVDGMAVFVPQSAVGDELRVKIVKCQKNYAFGKIEEILRPGADRIAALCPHFLQCGGCMWRHISYEAELKEKQKWVEDALARIGGVQHPQVQPIVAARTPDRYRNKAQFPVGTDRSGRVCLGFFAPRSHRVVPVEYCLLQPQVFDQAMQAFLSWANTHPVPVYQEGSHEGVLRHLYLRVGMQTGEVMVCVVGNAAALPYARELVSLLRAQVPGLASVVYNVNQDRTNVILGKTTQTLWGADVIQDRLCGLTFRLSPLSFYQVNHDQAERLYTLAKEYAAPTKDDILLDLYCGTGTIGLTMAQQAKQVIGVEVVPAAVDDAKQNARQNGIQNAEFFAGDASEAAARFYQQGTRPNVVVLDPPRKGCGCELVHTVAAMQPDRVVYVSCDPATLARDVKEFSACGYPLAKATPVDMFPRTGHVETVVLLQRGTW